MMGVLTRLFNVDQSDTILEHRYARHSDIIAVLRSAEDNMLLALSYGSQKNARIDLALRTELIEMIECLREYINEVEYQYEER